MKDEVTEETCADAVVSPRPAKKGMFADIPVDVGLVYEGERIRKPDMYAELGGPKVKHKFELLRVKRLDEIEDGKITVVGQEIQNLKERSSNPFGIYIEAAGKKLEEEMEIVKKIVETCHAARNSAGLKLRWPVKRVMVVSEDEKVSGAVKKLEAVLLGMCNAKSVEVVKESPEGEFGELEFDYGKVLVDKKMDEELLEEAMLREIIREIQSMRKKHGFNIEDNILLTLNSDEDTNKILKKHVGELKKEVGAKNVDIGIADGEFESELKFEDKNISVAFSKV